MPILAILDSWCFFGWPNVQVMPLNIKNFHTYTYIIYIGSMPCRSLALSERVAATDLPNAASMTGWFTWFTESSVKIRWVKKHQPKRSEGITGVAFTLFFFKPRGYDPDSLGIRYGIWWIWRSTSCSTLDVGDNTQITQRKSKHWL